MSERSEGEMEGDRDQIVDLAVRYCTALDTRDWALLGRCFTEDAVVVYSGGEPLLGRQAMVEFVRPLLTALDATQHINTNFVVEVDGDTATLTSYLHAQHVRAGAEGGPHFVFAGTYRDELVRVDGSWLIARRELTTTWTEGNAALLSG